MILQDFDENYGITDAKDENGFVIRCNYIFCREHIRVPLTGSAICPNCGRVFFIQNSRVVYYEK